MTLLQRLGVTSVKMSDGTRLKRMFILKQYFYLKKLNSKGYNIKGPLVYLDNNLSGWNVYDKRLQNIKELL